MKIRAFLPCLLVLSAPLALAEVRTVSEGQSILAAVKASSPGDTVRVLPGVYRETVYIDKDNITLQGVLVGGARPVLDGGNELKDGVLVAAFLAEAGLPRGPDVLATWIAAPTRMNPEFPEMPPQDYLPEKTRLTVARHVLGLTPKQAVAE